MNVPKRPAGQRERSSRPECWCARRCEGQRARLARHAAEPETRAGTDVHVADDVRAGRDEGGFVNGWLDALEGPERTRHFHGFSLARHADGTAQAAGRAAVSRATSPTRVEVTRRAQICRSPHLRRAENPLRPRPAFQPRGANALAVILHRWPFFAALSMKRTTNFPAATALALLATTFTVASQAAAAAPRQIRAPLRLRQNPGLR